jgi:hypothetical protein
MNDALGLGKAVTETLGVLKEPVQTLLGPAWTELAGTFGDSVRHWRDMRRLERAMAAVKKLQAKGLSPKAVDPSILFPILDAASLVEDEDLKAKWDALLANAADPTSTIDVIPSFSSILSELSPLEAHILDAVYAAGISAYLRTAISDRIPPEQIVALNIALSKRDIKRTFNITQAQFKVIADNLLRLRLCQTSAFEIGNTKVQLHDIHNLRLTALGRAFIQACKYE